MKDKFTMELTWHNCLTHPPKENWNDNLYASDGEHIFPVSYHEEHGWFDKDVEVYVPQTRLCCYWWADLLQTVQGTDEFKEAT
jgi:hypothetical protein